MQSECSDEERQQKSALYLKDYNTVTSKVMKDFCFLLITPYASTGEKDDEYITNLNKSIQILFVQALGLKRISFQMALPS